MCSFIGCLFLQCHCGTDGSRSSWKLFPSWRPVVGCRYGEIPALEQLRFLDRNGSMFICQSNVEMKSQTHNLYDKEYSSHVPTSSATWIALGHHQTNVSGICFSSAVFVCGSQHGVTGTCCWGVGVQQWWVRGSGLFAERTSGAHGRGMYRRMLLTHTVYLTCSKSDTKVCKRNVS